jgi:multidrug resistance efflux pump
MNKWLLVLLVLVCIVFGWYYVSTNVRFTPNWLQARFGKVTRGNIRVPITAAGLIRAKEQIEIKSEASGRVIEVPVVAGRYVNKGDVLVRLDPEDEQRSVDRASDDVERLRLTVLQAENAIENAKASLIIAEAQLEEARSTLRVREEDLAAVLRRKERGDTTNQEEISTLSARDIALATVKRAEQNVIVQQIAIRDAENNKKIQERLLSSAETTLGDARQRLAETTIVAPATGIVTSIEVQVGSVVQSGTGSFTGGTVLGTLSDISSKNVIARVDESDYGRILDISPVDALPQVPGLREAAAANAELMEARSGIVKLSVDAFPEKLFEGRIERVEPQGKLNTGSSIIQYDVHVLITDEEVYRLPLGAQAQVEFTVESADDVLRVPAEAVKTHESQKGVWLKTPPPPGSREQWGKRFIPCQFGITDGEYTEVVRTLTGEELPVDAEVFTKVPEKKDQE